MECGAGSVQRRMEPSVRPIVKSVAALGCGQHVLITCWKIAVSLPMISAPSCGICTFLCPTCYCFDINDELSGGCGARFRSLDSCSFPIYTRMPMENPRTEKWRRVRNKVCHKYEFYPMSFDVIACTGCGRCIRLCPVNWDITQTLSSLPAEV